MPSVLPDGVWHHIVFFLAACSPEHLIHLSMVCTTLMRLVREDHSLWIRLLRESEENKWRAADASGFYRVPTAPPLNFVALSPCPDFLRNCSRHPVAASLR